MTLDKPAHGWVDIHVGEFVDRASYLTDVLMDILQSLIFSYEHHLPAAIKFDAEGWEWMLVIDNYDVHIISNNCDEGFTYYNYEISKSEFTKEVIKNILEYIDDWSNWDFDTTGEKAVARRKELILVLIDKLNIVVG